MAACVCGREREEKGKKISSGVGRTLVLRSILKLQLKICKISWGLHPEFNEITVACARGRLLGCSKNLAEEMLMLENLEKLDCFGGWLSKGLVA